MWRRASMRMRTMQIFEDNRTISQTASFVNDESQVKEEDDVVVL